MWDARHFIFHWQSSSMGWFLQQLGKCLCWVILTDWPGDVIKLPTNLQLVNDVYDSLFHALSATVENTNILYIWWGKSNGRFLSFLWFTCTHYLTFSRIENQSRNRHNPHLCSDPWCPIMVSTGGRGTLHTQTEHNDQHRSSFCCCCRWSGKHPLQDSSGCYSQCQGICTLLDFYCDPT